MFSMHLYENYSVVNHVDIKVATIAENKKELTVLDYAFIKYF